MIFLTIFGVTQILCSFKLVLEGKTGNKITESSKLEFLENFSANNFALLDADDNTSASLNRRGIADLPLLRTLLAICQKSQEPRFWEVMDYFVFIRICKFSTFKKPLATITGLSELYLRSRFILLVRTKKVISMNYGSSTSS